MKKVITMAAVVACAAASLAEVFALRPGINAVPAARGQFLAADAATTNASATVTISASEHYGSASPETTTFVFTGDYLVGGASEDDSIFIIVK